MKKKNFKRIIIICGILILILVFAIIIISIVSNTGESDALGTSNTNLDTDKVIPMSAEAFFQEYTGDVSEEDVYKVITKLANYIIDNKQDINNWDTDEMYDIYSENEEEMKDMGIVDDESFVNIMKEAKEIQEDELSLSYTSFEIDTISSVSDGIEVEIIIKYAGVDALTFILSLSNDASSENPIQIYVN